MSDGPSPQEMQRIIEDIEQKMENRIAGDQRETQELESQEEEMEEDADQNLKATAEEIEDAEANASREEVDDAVRKEEGIEEIIEEQEKLIEEAIKDLEEQLKLFANEEKEMEQVEKELLTSLKGIRGDLEKTRNDITANSLSKHKKVISDDLEKLEEDIDTLSKDNEIFQEILDEQEEIIELFENTEKEDLKLENSISTIKNELGMTEKEVKELILDTEKMQDKKGYEKAEAEEHELEELIREWNQEQAEINKINQRIEEEIQESKVLISEDGEIIQELIKILNLLEQVEELLIENQGALKPIITAKSWKIILKDINKVQNELKNSIQRERSKIDEIKDRATHAAGAVNKILEEASTDEQGNKTNLGKTLEWVLGIILAAAITLWALGEFGMIGAAGALALIVGAYWIFFEL